MNMSSSARLFGGIPALVLFFMAVVLGGCAKDSVPPTSSDDDGLGSDATVYVSDPVSSEEADSVRENIRQNEQVVIVITPQQAAQTAAAEYPDAEVLGLNLDYDRNELNYECVVRSNGKVYVVVISPETGQVREKKEIDNYYYTSVIIIRPTVIMVKDACNRAREVADGDVVEANIEEIEGRTTYVIVILNAENRYVTVYVDGETGKERKLDREDDDKCEESDHGDHHKNRRGRGHYRHGKGHGYGHHYHCHCKCEDDDDDNGGDDNDACNNPNAPDGIIDCDSARAVVGAMLDSTEVVELNLDIQNDSTAFYEFELKRDTNNYEVKIDAFTGALVEIKQTSGDFENGEYEPNIDGVTLLPLSTVRATAVGEVTGEMTLWKLEYDESDGRWVYIFEITETATQTMKTVTIDAETGAVISVV